MSHPMTLYTLFRARVAAAPNSVAIVDGDTSVTYAQLDDRVVNAAAYMRSTVGAFLFDGPPLVAMCMGHSIETLQTVLAASLAGLRLCVLDPSLGPRELGNILQDCQPAAVFSQPAYASKLIAAVDAVVPKPQLVLATSELAAGALSASDRRGSPPSDDDDFLILYTSGTTGMPKGVVLSHAGLINRMQNWNVELQITAHDSHLCILPLSHAYGLMGAALPALICGNALHLLSLESHTLEDVPRYIAGHGITCFYGLPLHFRLMLKLPEAARPRLTSLRIAMVAAAAIDEATTAAFTEHFGVGMNNAYGTSETGTITYNRRDADAPAVSIGRPIAGIEYELRNPQQLDNRRVGELFIRTNAMAAHYVASSFGPVTQGGWFNTGDLVHEDENGYFHIGGRTSLLINVAGNKFVPTEVEHVIAQLGAVADVAVTSIRDPVAGEQVVAFVVRNGEISAAEVRKHCRQQLAGFKVPALIQWVERIPRTALNKTNRSELLKNL
jgi:long-chain acyl-CoA synthetase